MSAYVLDAPSADDCEAVRGWRNRDDVRAGLRTPHMLTDAMQRSFYEDVVCDRRAASRWWAVRGASGGAPLLAFAGLTGIAWEDGHAEVSLLVSPAHRGEGVGGRALRLVLREAFGRMRLRTVFGEVYAHNPASRFWLRRVEAYSGGHTLLPRRKWWDGRLHDGIVFWFTAEGWRAAGAAGPEAAA